jgi:RNA polymerase sigma factor for flagellar operon FliA
MPDADHEFVERHRALVESIVRSVQNQLHMTGNTAELTAFAMVGLVEARARYDVSRGVQFSTFAYYRIRGAVIDGIGKMARVPRTAVRASRAASVLDAESEHVAEARANSADAADPKQAAVDSISLVLSRAATAYALAALATQATTPEQDVAHRQSVEAIRQATDKLPERERKVILGHYVEERSLDEIGKELGLSKSWMSRLHAKALDQLRALLTGED